MVERCHPEASGTSEVGRAALLDSSGCLTGDGENNFALLQRRRRRRRGVGQVVVKVVVIVVVVAVALAVAVAEAAAAVVVGFRLQL